MKQYDYKDPSTIAKTLLVFLAIGTLLDIIAIFSGYSEHSLLVSYRNGTEISDEAADASDSRQAMIGSLQVAVYLATVVVFCMWTYRISSNAHSMSPGLKTSPGWAVGFYFIPIVTLWKPYQALKEAYDSFSPIRSTLVFPFWWFVWIVSNIVGRILFRTTLSAESLDEVIRASFLTLCSDIWNVLLDGLAIMLALIVTRECRRTRAQIEEAALATSEPEPPALRS